MLGSIRSSTSRSRTMGGLSTTEGSEARTTSSARGVSEPSSMAGSPASFGALGQKAAAPNDTFGLRHGVSNLSWPMVLERLQSMRERGCPPDVVTYTTVPAALDRVEENVDCVGKWLVLDVELL